VWSWETKSGACFCVSEGEIASNSEASAACRARNQLMVIIKVRDASQNMLRSRISGHCDDRRGSSVAAVKV
jgi:hypothetical protein